MTAPRTALPYIFSASQVETFMGCPRKWAWKTIAGIKPPQAESAQIGDASHGQLQGYIEGKPIDFTQVVHGVRIADVIAPGLGLLPAPMTPGVVCETVFNFPSKRGPWTWTGRKDLFVPDGALFPKCAEPNPDVPDVPEGAPVVSDHKTTSAIFHAKTPDDLEWDVQAGLYAHEECERSNVPAVDLVWTYYQTRGAKRSKRVHLRMARDHAAEAFARIETIAAQMAAHLDAAACELDKAAYVQSMPPNPKVCGKFGGCPYTGQCSLTQKERFQAEMSGDFFANLEAVAKQQDAATIQDKPDTMGCSDKDVPAADPDIIPAAFRTDAPAPLTTPSVDPNAVKVNPPESTQPVQTPPAQPTATTAPAEAPKRGRGRPPKNKDAGIATTAAPTATVNPEGVILNPSTLPPQPDTTASPDTSHRPKADGPALPMQLFVDCIPVGKTVTYAAQLVDKANAKIAAQFANSDEPVAHYKFLPYGKGQGALDIALGLVLDELKPTHVFCAGTSDALAVLERRASFVIRSVK